MSKIYNTQTDLKIIVTTNKNLTTASEVRLKYINPKMEVGEFSVTVTDAPNGVFEYVTPVGQPLAIAGNWRMWSYVVDNGLVSIGQPFILTLRKEGFEQ